MLGFSSPPNSRPISAVPGKAGFGHSWAGRLDLFDGETTSHS